MRTRPLTRFFSVISMAAALTALPALAAAGETLERIKADEIVRFGFRTDAPPFFQEDVTFAAGDRYYLVVPHTADEGSYGLDSGGAERPVGSATCVAAQSLGCP